MKRNKLFRVVWVLCGVHLAGCSFAPTYHVPEVNLPAAFKENDQWQDASPQDTESRGKWWVDFGDKKLDELEAAAESQNTQLAIALARFDAANAYASAIDSELLPSVDLDASGFRNRQSDHRPLRGSNQPDVYTANTVGFRASYEVDLWGRVRDEVKIGAAGVEAAKADLASAKLSMQAQLADLYILMRGYDVESDLLGKTITAYERALKLTENRHTGGITSGLDVARAQTQLASARAEAAELSSRRSLAEHAIAELVGVPASQFGIAANTSVLNVPAVPAATPADLLQRRPDVAAAERRVFAANASIGVARAAFFPRLGLTGSFGWQDTGGALISAPERFWAIGPQALLSVFDAGLHEARLAGARAEFDAAAAHYRGTVLLAMRQAEDQLALSKHLADESKEEAVAVTAAQKALEIATHRYEEGVVNYLEVVTAQTAALQSQRSALELTTRRLRARIALIRSLGGSPSAGGGAG